MPLFDRKHEEEQNGSVRMPLPPVSTEPDRKAVQLLLGPDVGRKLTEDEIMIKKWYALFQQIPKGQFRRLDMYFRERGQQEWRRGMQHLLNRHKFLVKRKKEGIETMDMVRTELALYIEGRRNGTL